MHIAIIGAGIAGLICARKLQAQGNTVVVYEKCRDVSGRMSTCETEMGGFDYGAQYFTATSEQFKETVRKWHSAGWIAPWDARLVTVNKGAIEPVRNSQQRFVAMPGMNALGRLLAQALEVRTEHFVKRIDQYGSQLLLAVENDAVPIEASAGPFDAVMVAVPADQAIPLLGVVPAFVQQAEQAHLAPCWALMLGFQEPLGLNYDGAWVQNSRLAWICNEASKPQRRPGEHWVAHATIPWSIEHFGEELERAKDKLLKAFHEATGSLVQPIYAVAHRWRYAQATKPLATDYLWDAKLRIGVCGDWFAAGLEGSGRIENAYLSGCALAEAAG
jgi:renalase